MSDIREDIIQIALDKMAQVGIRSLSIDDICRLMGISKKTFYVHFETKADLVDTVLKFHEQMVCDKVYQMIETQSIEKTLSACFAIVYQTKRVMQPPAFIYDMQKYYPQQFEAYKASIFRNTQSFVSKFLEKGIADGFFRRDLDITLTARLFAMLHQGILGTLADIDPNEEHQLSETAKYGFGLLLRGIVSHDGGERIKALCEEAEKNAFVNNGEQ